MDSMVKVFLLSQHYAKLGFICLLDNRHKAEVSFIQE